MTETFVGELNARSWTERAACANAPDLNWTCSPARGIEAATTVMGCLTICSICPVRRECLDAAIEDQTHTMLGVWGGTTMTERTKALIMARPLVGTETEARRIAADYLEHTFEARYAMWLARSQHRTPMALIVTETWPCCPHCGQGWLWEDPDSRCTRWCRKVERTHLKAVAA